MTSLTLESPAKINLMLSVHGPREDGFHALTSVVVALKFGDTLSVSMDDRGESGEDRLRCSDKDVPTGGENIILRAAAVFRRKAGREHTFHFDLIKRIPMGAGLGGGSSNAAVALRGMNELSGGPLSRGELIEAAAELGSDCPFFIDSVPAEMSGRGETLKALPAEIADRLRGQRIVLFKPDFGVETASAYGRLIKGGASSYEAEHLAHARWARFADSGDFADLLFNSFESSVGAKYLAIPSLLELLRERGYLCLMSGSGSCCFAFAAENEESEYLRRICESSWGSKAFCVETSTL